MCDFAGLCFPYLFLLSQHALPSTVVQALFTLLITLTSPLLVPNISFNSPLPIPTGLFDIRGPANPNQIFLPGSLPPRKWSHEYKCSTSPSVTVVEGRRSGDVWLSKGNAVDGKGKTRCFWRSHCKLFRFLLIDITRNRNRYVFRSHKAISPTTSRFHTASRHVTAATSNHHLPPASNRLKPHSIHFSRLPIRQHDVASHSKHWY